jgi:hypothetical protein
MAQKDKTIKQQKHHQKDKENVGIKQHERSRAFVVF